MRSAADAVTQQWGKLAGDAELAKKVEAINAATGKKFKLQPTTGFVTGERNLQKLEQTVLSAAIPLANEDGGLWVDVVVNGKHTTRMVLDSGATSIALPYAMAKDFGMEPTSRDEKIVVSLADGSMVPATRMKITSVRVGKFSLDDVDCVVLDRAAVRATPLLGMSFLGKFKFEVDEQKAELRMVSVESGEDLKDKGKSKSKATAKPKKKAM